jgi:hypothetical protein
MSNIEKIVVGGPWGALALLWALHETCNHERYVCQSITFSFLQHFHCDRCAQVWSFMFWIFWHWGCSNLPLLKEERCGIHVWSSPVQLFMFIWSNKYNIILIYSWHFRLLGVDKDDITFYFASTFFLYRMCAEILFYESLCGNNSCLADAPKSRTGIMHYRCWDYSSYYHITTSFNLILLGSNQSCWAFSVHIWVLFFCNVK